MGVERGVIMEELVSLFVNNGVAIAVVIYFLWKDSALTKENTAILNEIKGLLEIVIQKEGEMKK